MLQRHVALAALCAAAIVSSGCASIIRGGGPQSISIRSTPADAEVKILDAETGTELQNGKTPMLLSLDKSRGFFHGAHYKIVVAKAGFETREVVLEPSVNGWYVAGNVLFGGLIGWLIVDPATGAMWTLEPAEFDLELKATEPPPAQGGGTPVASAEVMTLAQLATEHPELVAKLRPVLP